VAAVRRFDARLIELIGRALPQISRNLLDGVYSFLVAWLELNAESPALVAGHFSEMIFLLELESSSGETNQRYRDRYAPYCRNYSQENRQSIEWVDDGRIRKRINQMGMRIQMVKRINHVAPFRDHHRQKS
jgi:hypothetical protein